MIESRPIFIIGAPRSGTSVTTWSIGQLPNVQVIPETSWISTLAVGAYQSFSIGTSRGKFSHLSNAPYELPAFMAHIGAAADAITQECFGIRTKRIYGDYWQSGELAMNPRQAESQYQLMRTASDPKSRWIDGTPYNSFFIWGISLMFPKALFIHNLRAPSDVATSLEGFDKLGQNPQELKDGLDTWRSHTERAALAERAFGKAKVFRLDFSRISKEPEALIQEVCEFIGEEFTADCLAPLGVRINSSEVDERREENLAALRKLPEFITCSSLFEQLQTNPPDESQNSEALNELKQQFLDHCGRYPLI